MRHWDLTPVAHFCVAGVRSWLQRDQRRLRGRRRVLVLYAVLLRLLTAVQLFDQGEDDRLRVFPDLLQVSANSAAQDLRLLHRGLELLNRRLRCQSLGLFELGDYGVEVLLRPLDHRWAHIAVW